MVGSAGPHWDPWWGWWVRGGVDGSVVSLLGPWWVWWVRDGFFGSVMFFFGSVVVSVGPWWDQETSVLCHGLLDPVKVVVDQAVDPWLPRLPAGVVAPGDDALQHPVAYQGSPRVTLGTKGAVMGPGPWPPDRRGHLATGGGRQLVLETMVWVQPKRGGATKRHGCGAGGGCGAWGHGGGLRTMGPKGRGYGVVARGHGDISKIRGR